MELWSMIGGVGREWTQAIAEAQVAAWPGPGTSFLATMSDAVWGVSAVGRTDDGSLIIGGHGEEPAQCIVRMVGGGMTVGRSWSVWVLCPWSEREKILSAEEREVLEGRAAFLREAIRRWEEETAKHPGVPARGGVTEWRAELVAILARLVWDGTYYLVVYVGYARRWGRNEYVLRM